MVKNKNFLKIGDTSFKNKIKFHLKATVLKSLFNKVACLGVFFAKAVNTEMKLFTKSFIVDIWHGSKYAFEPQT